MIALLTNRFFLWCVCAGCAVTIVVVSVLMLGEAAGRRTAERQLAKSGKVLKATQGELALCTANLTGARTSIDSQNAAIAELQADATEAQRRADARVAAARKEADAYRTRAARIAASTTTHPDRCKAAADLYLKTIPDLH